MNEKASIKQDINFLDKPMWFLKAREEKGADFVWTDIEGYEYRGLYKSPDKIDMLILLYLLYKSQENGYLQSLELSRYEILRACNLPYTDPKYYKRLEDSLERWKRVTIKFKGTFYDGGRYKTLLFGILDTGRITDNNKVIVEFNKNWLLKIRESNFFKYVNFHHYIGLKRPISRRLHEILCTKFVNRGTWSIHLVKLGYKLTLQGRKTKNGMVLYASDVLVAIKPAINEINKLAKDPDMAKKGGIKSKDLFTITYKIIGEKQDRVIVFQRHRVFIEENRQDKPSDVIEALLALCKRKTEQLENAIIQYVEEEGIEYVKWNIVYANKYAKKSYTTYLNKALQENWAEGWAEEEKIRIAQEIEKEQEYQLQIDEQKKEEELRELAKEQVSFFRQAADALDDKLKWKLWNQADSEIPENMCRPKMNIKIRYAELVLEHLNDRGGNFVRQVLNDFGMIFDIALKKERDR